MPTESLTAAEAKLLLANERELLEMAFNLGWSVSMRRVLDGTYRAWFHNDERAGKGALKYGPTVREALLLALVAVKAQEEKP